MKPVLLALVFILSVLNVHSATLMVKKDTITFSVTAYDGLELPAQVIYPAEKPIGGVVVFINGSTPSDEKGNMAPMLDENGHPVLVRQDFYSRFQDFMPTLGYATVSMAKRSLVEYSKIPRPTLDELALDVAFLVKELRKKEIITADNEFYLVGYSEGSIVASKVLGWLKEQPRACILLGSGSSAFDYNKSWEEWPHAALYKRLKNLSDEEIKKEYGQIKDIMISIRNMDEETFENEYKKSKPHGFGIAQWESFYIDSEISLYYPEDNLIDANIPLLICIGENDMAMPERRAFMTYQNLLDRGFDKTTYKMIPEEVHQYRKYDVFGIIASWISSDFGSTNFTITPAAQELIDKYTVHQELKSEFKKVPFSGSPEKVLSFYRKAVSEKMTDTDTWFTLGVKLVGNGCMNEAYTSFSKSNVEGTMIQSGSCTWLGHLNDLKGNRMQAQEFYRKALDVYPGFPVQHSQWEMSLSKEWLSDRIEHPFTSEMLKTK
jgi:hypothetical protein